LADHEQHLHSLKLVDAMKIPLGYKIGLVSFDGHLTTARLILEAQDFPKWMKPLMKTVGHLFHASAAASVYMGDQIKSQEARQVQVAGQSFSIPVDCIKRFETVKVMFIPQCCRLVFDESVACSEADSYVFYPFPSTAFGSLSVADRLSSAALGGIFSDFANDWLRNVRKRDV